MDLILGGLKWLVDGFWYWASYILGKIWQLWYGTYLWLIPGAGLVGAFLIVTLIPIIIVLVLLYMGIAKYQISIETFGHTSFQIGLIVIGVILVIVILKFILPTLE